MNFRWKMIQVTGISEVFESDTHFIISRVISPRKEEIKINKRSAGEGFGLNFDTVFYIEEVVPNSLASKHHFKGNGSTI